MSDVLMSSAGAALANYPADRLKAPTDSMCIPRQHRLDAMPGYLGQVGVVNARGTEVGDVAVAALMGADV